MRRRSRCDTAQMPGTRGRREQPQRISPQQHRAVSLDHREVVGGGLVGLLRLHPVEERVGAGQRDGPDDRGGVATRHGSPRLGALLRGDRCGFLLSQAVDPLVVSRATRGRSAGFGYLLKDRVLDPSTFLRQLEEVAAGATVTDPGVLPDAMRRSGASRA